MRLKRHVAMLYRRALRFGASVAIFGLALTVLNHAAVACTVPQPYDPSTAFTSRTREEIVKLPEVIIEGVIEDYEPAANEAGKPNDHTGFTRMRIDRVWKGELAPTIVVLFATASSDCSQPPPFGQRIRFGGYLVEKSILLRQNAISLTPQRRELLEANHDVLYFGRFGGWLPFALPLQDAEFDRLLTDYQVKTEAFRMQAASGSKQERLAYAAYLTENNEVHRALEVYEAVFREYPDDLDLHLTLAVARTKVFPKDEPDATLTEIARQAPKTDEWRNKIVRTRLAATGKFTPGWKDWSELKPAGNCVGWQQNFDGASFDGADLSGCNFQSASFKGTSFRRTKLGNANLNWAVMTGSQYDCATKFPPNFDPAKEGMVNVEASCPAQAPQEPQ
jgi:hypothetical protein